VGRVLFALATALAAFMARTVAPDAPIPLHVAMVVYAGYSVVLLAVAWSPLAIRLGYQMATHAVDVTIFALLTRYGGAPGSAPLVFFTFALVSATMRWQWRGTLGTAVAALLMMTGLAWYGTITGHGPGFAMSPFGTRSIYLTVIAVLLGYLGTHEARARGDMAMLARWPDPVLESSDAMLRGALGYAATLLSAPRLLLVWQESGEPVVHQALWVRGELTRTSEPRAGIGGLVADVVAGGGFFCADVGALAPRTWCHVGGRFRELRRRPVDDGLWGPYAMRQILGAPLPDRERPGFVFALDRRHVTFDDVLLAEVVGRQLVARLRYFALYRRARDAAVAEERLSLARDLHDGLLQSLTGAALQLAAAREMVPRDPGAAGCRLAALEALIRAEQRDIREQIQGWGPGGGATLPSRNLADRLRALAQTTRSLWGIDVALCVDDRVNAVTVPGQQVYWLVREALWNVVRHSGATATTVAVRLEDAAVRVVVVDNGHGLPFQGRYEHTELERRNLGPVSLRERAIRLGGTLVIESCETGARLDLYVPLTPAGADP
jgi:signal transduction histidine kinase